MQLPALSSVQRYTLPRPPGSADAALLANLVAREKAQGRRVSLICANAFDAQRLLEEMQFFQPDLAFTHASSYSFFIVFAFASNFSISALLHVSFPLISLGYFRSIAAFSA